MDDDTGCPGCRAPVAFTTLGSPLAESEPIHVAGLIRGAFLILASVVIVLVVMVAQVLLNAAGAFTPGAGSTLEIGLQGANFLGGIAGFIGWWKFSAPDPSVTGQNRGNGSRLLIRVTVLLQMTISLGGMTLLLTSPGAVLPPPGAQAPPPSPGLLALGFANLFLSAVWFFASMMYLRWLAPRVPNAKVYKRAQTMLWLGPVLVVPGMCIIVGPLIAVVLYWNMIYWVWKDLRTIATRQSGLDDLAPAPL